MAARPVCPMCKEAGIHPTAAACIAALRALVEQLRTQMANQPA